MLVFISLFFNFLLLYCLPLISTHQNHLTGSLIAALLIARNSVELHQFLNNCLVAIAFCISGFPLAPLH